MAWVFLHVLEEGQRILGLGGRATGGDQACRIGLVQQEAAAGGPELLEAVVPAGRARQAAQARHRRTVDAQGGRGSGVAVNAVDVLGLALVQAQAGTDFPEEAIAHFVDQIAAPVGRAAFGMAMVVEEGGDVPVVAVGDVIAGVGQIAAAVDHRRADGLGCGPEQVHDRIGLLVIAVGMGQLGGGTQLGRGLPDGTQGVLLAA